MISAGLWAASLALAFWWSFSPLFKSHRPAPKIQTTAAEDTDALLEAEDNRVQLDEKQTTKMFPVRLAPLVAPALASLADDQSAEQPPFDFRNWAVRETKRRGFLSFLGLMISGSVLQWLLNRWAHPQADDRARASA